MNILVTGANGQLGNEIQKVSKHSQDHYIFTDVCEGYEKLVSQILMLFVRW